MKSWNTLSKIKKLQGLNLKNFLISIFQLKTSRTFAHFNSNFYRSKHITSIKFLAHISPLSKNPFDSCMEVESIKLIGRLSYEHERASTRTFPKRWRKAPNEIAFVALFHPFYSLFFNHQHFDVAKNFFHAN